MERKKKLYLIGVDSAPLWLIKKLEKKHQMRGFERFEQEGVLREMDSTLPPVTAAAWPTIYTGLEPGEHGVMDFLYLDKNYSKQLIYYDSSLNPPFWERLAKMGLKSLVVTPAMSLQKGESENIDMITGWPLQPRYSSREMERAAKKFGFKGEPEIGIELEKGEISVQNASKRYLQSIKSRSEMSKYLIKKGEYDMAFVCFTETDRIQHYALSLENWEESVAPLYKEVSDFAEWVIEYSRSRNEEAVILLVSDHGAQPIRNKFLINSWLIKEGFAKLLEKEGKAKKQSGVVEVARRHIRERAMKLKIRRLVYNKMPPFLRNFAERVIEEIPDEEYLGGKYLKIHETDFEMSSTKAFAAISFGTIGMIWLNDERFSTPGIEKKDAAAVRKRIIEGLGKIRSAEGDRLVIATYDGYKYYKNSGAFIIPDIMFEMKPNYINDFTYVAKREIFMEPEINRKGDHSRLGIIGAISTSKQFSAKRLAKGKIAVGNVGPTILSYFGDKSMKGRSLI